MASEDFLPLLPEAFREIPTLSEILLGGVPQEGMVGSQEKYSTVPDLSDAFRKDSTTPDLLLSKMPLAGVVQPEGDGGMTPRCCDYCRAEFTPRRPQDLNARFCCADHRKKYHQHGGLPFEKLAHELKQSSALTRDDIRLIVRQELAALLRPLFTSAASAPPSA